jgi:hypothetical protein
MLDYILNTNNYAQIKHTDNGAYFKILTIESRIIIHNITRLHQHESLLCCSKRQYKMITTDEHVYHDFDRHTTCGRVKPVSFGTRSYFCTRFITKS